MEQTVVLIIVNLVVIAIMKYSFNEQNHEEYELHSSVRYKITADLEDEILEYQQD